MNILYTVYNICTCYLQGDGVQWTVFLISYWGDQIGQKVKKICDWCVSIIVLVRFPHCCKVLYKF